MARIDRRWVRMRMGIPSMDRIGIGRAFRLGTPLREDGWGMP
jgi:hypothetical protein